MYDMKNKMISFSVFELIKRISNLNDDEIPLVSRT